MKRLTPFQRDFLKDKLIPWLVKHKLNHIEMIQEVLTKGCYEEWEGDIINAFIQIYNQKALTMNPLTPKQAHFLEKHLIPWLKHIKADFGLFMMNEILESKEYGTPQSEVINEFIDTYKHWRTLNRKL